MLLIPFIKIIGDKNKQNREEIKLKNGFFELSTTALTKAPPLLSSSAN